MDSYELSRFIHAQDPAYDAAVRELRAGRKSTHWMWFVFPQLEGLGTSPMARRYAIRSLAEARAYLEHPLLGRRLSDCTDLVLEIEGRPIGEIFGFPDDRKFHSSMTLFAQAGGGGTRFAHALEQFFSSVLDPKTMKLLRSE
jgi:uncharacterized protein (DUF1810 family)